jgi:hypothetical protein
MAAGLHQDIAANECDEQDGQDARQPKRTDEKTTAPLC